jgi:hypothetical protein
MTTDPIAVTIVDVAAKAREMYGDDFADIAGRPVPRHDWRFEAKTPTGGDITFGRHTTAEQIATYFAQLEQEANR